MLRSEHARWNWIVGGLIVAAALIVGAFITRDHDPRAALPGFSIEAQMAGVTASNQFVI